ncbi:MAG: TIGR00266 family protein [Anaerolineales bacterium]|nr:TIGR00266 family protein [Anaerolineales bacterium]
MQYKIYGTTFPSLDLILDAGESVFTETGGMAWMTGDIDMMTSTQGSLLKGLARRMAGESLFLTDYTCRQDQALITFTPSAPGHIVTVELGEGESRICQKDAFLVAQSGVDFSIHYRTKLGAGLFGGEGFILQKLTGPGLAWVEIAGEVRAYTLKEGQTMKINPGHIAMYDPSIKYDITRVRGVRNMLFGDEGVFLATLTGPGRVWLQSMTLSSLAGKLRPHLSLNQS